MSVCKIVDVRISGGKNVAEVFWSDDHVSRFHTIWLRCNCRCDICRRTIVGQANVERYMLPCNLLLNSAKIEEDGGKLSLVMDPEENHVTVMDSSWLRNACYCDQCRHILVTQGNMTFYDPQTSEIPRIDAKEIDTDEGKFKFMEAVFNRGFLVVENLSRVEGTVVETGQKFAPIIETIYGKWFNVFDEKSTENVASTTIGLPFHTDQCAYEAAPGIQLLHAMEFDEQVTGGNSLVVDMFHVIDILRRESPEDFKVLARVPVAFGTIDYKRRLPAHMVHRKTIIVVDYDDQVVGWSWNPGTEQTVNVREEDTEPFFRAYIKLQKIIARQELWFKFRLKPGDMMVLQNRRVAHSRDEYHTNGGHRRLQGTYIDSEVLRSNYLVLGRKLGKNVVPPKIGNCSSI